jgi:hypothetical protein
MGSFYRKGKFETIIAKQILLDSKDRLYVLDKNGKVWREPPPGLDMWEKIPLPRENS